MNKVTYESSVSKRPITIKVKPEKLEQTIQAVEQSGRKVTKIE